MLDVVPGRHASITSRLLDESCASQIRSGSVDPPQFFEHFVNVRRYAHGGVLVNARHAHSVATSVHLIPAYHIARAKRGKETEIAFLFGL